MSESPNTLNPVPASATAAAASHVEPPGAGLEALGQALRVCFMLLIAAMLIGILVFIWRSFFVVEQQDVGLILRFGRITGEKPTDQVRQPGLYVALPYPIDEKISVPRTRQQTVQSDAFWYAPRTTGVPGALTPGVDGYTLTGDLNVMHSKWSARYTVTDPVAYSFRVSSQGGQPQFEHLLRLLLQQAVVRASGSLSVDDVWRNRENALVSQVQDGLKQQVKDLALGVEINAVVLEGGAATPPQQTGEAFQSVTKAAEERRGAHDQALSQATSIAATAAAEAERLRADANVYLAAKATTANAEADAFAGLYAGYKDHPENRAVVRATLLQDVVRRVLAKADRKFVVDEAPGRQLRLQLYKGPDVKHQPADASSK